MLETSYYSILLFPQILPIMLFKLPNIPVLFPVFAADHTHRLNRYSHQTICNTIHYTISITIFNFHFKVSRYIFTLFNPRDSCTVARLKLVGNLLKQILVVTNQPIIPVQVGKYAYYSSIICTKRKSLLCSKLCCHNLPRPTHSTASVIM